MAEPLAPTGVALRRALFANLEALAHLLDVMRASVDPATGPPAIRRCLQAVRQVVQHTETVAGLEPATPDDDPPNEVQAHVMLRCRSEDLRRRAVALQADLTKRSATGALSGGRA